VSELLFCRFSADLLRSPPRPVPGRGRRTVAQLRSAITLRAARPGPGHRVRISSPACTGGWPRRSRRDEASGAEGHRPGAPLLDRLPPGASGARSRPRGAIGPGSTTSVPPPSTILGGDETCGPTPGRWRRGGQRRHPEGGSARLRPGHRDLGVVVRNEGRWRGLGRFAPTWAGRSPLNAPSRRLYCPCQQRLLRPASVSVWTYQLAVPSAPLPHPAGPRGGRHGADLRPPVPLA